MRVGSRTTVVHQVTRIAAGRDTVRPMSPRAKTLIKRQAQRVQQRMLEPMTTAQSALIQGQQIRLALDYADRAADPQRPLPSYRDVGLRVFSEHDEDGILLFLLSVTGSGARRLVDIGASGIAASNSANLILHHGWTGLLVDANEQSTAATRAYYEQQGLMPPQIATTWVTAETVAGLVHDHGLDDADLLLIDIDGNDYWLWKALDIRPRVVAIEYQDILGPDRSVVIPYDPQFSVDAHPENAEENNYVGASLRALTKLAHAKGYRLAAVNRLGYNAFFVRDDLMGRLPEIPVEDGFAHPWNQHGIAERWPKVAHMAWQAV
jgi:hypothetical protein